MYNFSGIAQLPGMLICTICWSLTSAACAAAPLALSGLVAPPPNVRPGEFAVAVFGTGTDDGAFCGVEPSGLPGDEKLSG